MEYLTTHDLVWVNNIVTGNVQPYDYVTLEAAMAGQYSYGQSRDVVTQAATLLQRLLAKAPFAEGNRRTAFISTLTFLNANGYAAKVDDRAAALLVLEVERGDRLPVEAIEAMAAPATGGLPAGLTLRKLITHECNLHAEGLKALTSGD